ncbi:MAG: ComEC family competence protein [Winogradskyella sp.]|uniref:ComEC/Rec2 family competence protein n=1 Tax=Winogradskyella sp. TaxID=1883156 RepID=UPI0018074474|nr:ComEC family competence protein [Winogradskyella sp.]
MKLLNFTLIKLTLCLAVGIVLAHYANINFKIILYTTIGSVMALAICWFIQKSKISRLPFFAVLSYLCMIGIGVLTYKIQDEKLRANHYTHLDIKPYNSITFKIKERLKPDNYNEKYMVSLRSINGKNASGTVLINIKKDSLNPIRYVDDELFVYSQLQDIQQPLNPHQFDYRAYLELKHVYHQLYLDKNDIRLLSNSKTSLFGFADKLRATINTRLIDAGFKGEVLSIMNALLLGQRQTIDKATYRNYVNSGTIHILAVSGLHVGILLWILNFVFRPLLYLKHGNYLRLLVLVSILWTFAIIAGLSPSVTRAVAMFSIISMAMHLKRPTNIYNTLIISAFLILLFKPSFLFEVGFQMSYLAVLGIVSIQPIIYNLWKPQVLVTDKLWQIFTVTLAAQFGVVPISLFYFHQFPGLFFISNIVVIPFLGVILGSGLLVIVLALSNYLPELLVNSYSIIIDGLNGFIAWVAKFEDFLIQDIPFTLLQVISSYFIIIALVQLYRFRNFNWAAIVLIAIISFQCLSLYPILSPNHEALIIFNKSRHTLIGEHRHDQLIVTHNLDSLKASTDNVIKNYKVGEDLTIVNQDSLKSIYQFKDSKILIIDSIGVYQGLSFKPNYILLRSSPRINLNRMIDSLQPEYIIADASNYKSYIKRWKTTCRAKKIPFHATNEKGAFMLYN